jgi:ribokinase
MSVVVFGSINMDLVVQTPRLPRAGETLTAHTFFTASGGKGANQAVASARLDTPTRMVGRVGGDVFGPTLLRNLQGDRVDISGVTTDAAQPSGIAVIAVDDAAENMIIVAPGANGAIASEEVARLKDTLADATVLLLQLEIPMGAVVTAAQMAHEQGVKVILDPAPAQQLPPELYDLIDVLTPNETEAASLVGFDLADEDAVERAAEVLTQRGARNVVIKLGSRGAYWRHGTTGRFLPTFPVEAVDTVAAGDAFNGALAAALDEDREIAEALRWGLAAGALSVTKAGAQPSLPDRNAVMQLLQSHATNAE